MEAEIAQLGERQTEDLKVACSIHALGVSVLRAFFFVCLGAHLPQSPELQPRVAID